MNSKENKRRGLAADLLNQILRLRVGRSRKEIPTQPHTTYTLELMDPEKTGIVPVKMDSFPKELAEKITGNKWLLEMAFVERSSREDPLQISFVVVKNPQLDTHYFMYDTLQGGGTRILW